MKFLLLSSILSFTLMGCTSPATKINTSASPTITPSPTQTVASALTLTPASDNWRKSTHIHAIAVNPENSQMLYLATHHGILQKSASGEWQQVGKDRSDYMTFVAHPSHPGHFFGSGHPPTGGNLGFVTSEDYGENWKLLSMPGVDFHAMAIAPSKPEIIYGFATSGKKGLFVSQDFGNNWSQMSAIGLTDIPFSLKVTPHHPDHLFANTRQGLFESKDGGKNWTLVTNTAQAPIVSLTFTTEGEQTIMYAYRPESKSGGLFKSTDYGQTWSAITTPSKSLILHLTSAPNNSEILYAADQDNLIFQSVDRGKTWTEF